MAGDLVPSAWPVLMAGAEVSLLAAGVQAENGEGESVRRLLRLAETEARRELRALDGWFVVWPEWARFSDACDVEGWASRLPFRRVLRHRVADARQAFTDLLGRAQRLYRRASAGAGLGDALEDLLVQVWRCEREWRLDDRIEASLRTGQAGGGGPAVRPSPWPN